MRYLGGKALIAKHIVKAILGDSPDREVWFEPFVGGANVTYHAVPHFKSSFSYDIHPDLIAMWQAVTKGWIPPSAISRAEYDRLRTAEPSALRGFAGFACSYAGKWFGGYVGDRPNPRGVRTINQSGASIIVKQAAVFRRFDTKFCWGSYETLTPPPQSTIYCDPPYTNTTGYGVGDFDYNVYYTKLAEWSGKGCFVYASESSLPDFVDATILWSSTKKSTIAGKSQHMKRAENLYRIHGIR